MKQWETPVPSSSYKTLQNPLFWGTSTAPPWEAFMASKSVLVIGGNLEVLKCCGFMWHYAHTKLNKNPSVSLEERHAVTWWHHKPITMPKDIVGFMGNLGIEQLQCHVKFRSELWDDVKMKCAEMHFDRRKRIKLVQDYVHGRLDYTQLNIQALIAESWLRKH